MSCSVYFNYRDIVTVYGAKKASRVAISYIKNVITEMESMSLCRFASQSGFASLKEKPTSSSILESDGFSTTTIDSYGAIICFSYPNSRAAEAASHMIINWVIDTSSKLSIKVPVLGVVYSPARHVLSSECAFNLFRLSLSYNPTVFYLESEPPMPSIHRLLHDKGMDYEGHLICSRKSCSYVICDAYNIRFINKDTAIRLAQEYSDKASKNGSLVLYSYDSGNLLDDSEFFSYLKSLLVISSIVKGAIVSADLRSQCLRETAYSKKITHSNIVSYACSKKVSFEKGIAIVDTKDTCIADTKDICKIDTKDTCKIDTKDTCIANTKDKYPRDEAQQNYLNSKRDKAPYITLDKLF